MNPFGTALAVGICVAAAVMSARPADAQDAGIQHSAANVASRASGTPAPRTQAKPYFVEFRARAAQSYGHTYAVHGRVGQNITPSDVVGLHPATESPIPWMIGHLVLVPSETGASVGDADERYVTARYRVFLTEAEYKRTLAYMRKLQASSPVWHAVLYNCNAFVADIAKFMGLKTPPSTLVLPKEFVTELKVLNTIPRKVKPRTIAVAGRPASDVHAQ